MNEEGGIYDNEADSVQQYFKYYSSIANQQNMLSDQVRTGAYHDAIFSNSADFYNKVVMDVGAGSGVLSIFAAKAGAKRVFAVQASDMAFNAKILIKENKLDKIVGSVNIRLNPQDLEENQIDILVSQPIGTLLVNQRMLETYIIARDNFLKPGGLMFPHEGEICVCPFSDETLYSQQINKASFWNQTEYYGINLKGLHQSAIQQKLKQPIIDTYPPSLHITSQVARCQFNFTTVALSELKNFSFDFAFTSEKTAIIHGLAGWFQITFIGSSKKVVLDTSSSSPLTHWHQMRFLLQEPLAINCHQQLKGTIELSANKSQSYDIFLEMELPDLNIISKMTYDMKNPEYLQLYHWGHYDHSGAHYQNPQGSSNSNAYLGSSNEANS